MHQPSVNEGYSDWFDFSENDSRLNDYRVQFAITRERLKEIDTNIDATSPGTSHVNAEKLMSYAKFVYAANQYEFGCIGCYFPWYYRTKSALITAEAANYALNPSSTVEVIVQDLDKDGNYEYILRNAKAMYVFTGLGGRMINWYDIEHGEVLLANDIPNTYATWTVNGLGYDSGTYLSSPVDIVTGGDLWGRTENSYLLRPKAFYDSYSDGEADWLWKSRNRTVILGDSFVQFYLSISNRIISKVFELMPDKNTLQVTYNYQNDETFDITPEIGLSWSPGNEAILTNGRAILAQETTSNTTHTTVTTFNTLNGFSILYVFPFGPLPDGIDPMFGEGQTLTNPDISPDGIFTITLVLSAQNSTPVISESSTSTTSNTTSKTTGIPLGPFIVLLAIISVSWIPVSHRRFRKKRKN
jgi:hypothetical protein